MFVSLGCTEQPSVFSPSDIPRLTISIEEDLGLTYFWIRPTLGDFVIYRNITLYINNTLAFSVENAPSLLYVLNLSNTTYNVSVIVEYYDMKDNTLRIYVKNLTIEIVDGKIYVDGMYHGVSYDVTLEESEVIENAHRGNQTC